MQIGTPDPRLHNSIVEKGKKLIRVIRNENIYYYYSKNDRIHSQITCSINQKCQICRRRLNAEK